MMAMMGDSYDECDTSMILEPTPLSEVVHQQHVLNQQQQQQRIQEQHLYFVEDSDDYLFRSSKRQRGQPLRVSFSSEAMVHSSPRRIDEIASMWYSVFIKQNESPLPQIFSKHPFLHPLSIHPPISTLIDS
jgi:hypothetical protein